MSFWRKKLQTPIVDIHSHLIPNIDDGARSMAHSLEMIHEMLKLGYKKCITTPHIHPRYPNTPQLIKEGYDRLQNELSEKNSQMEIEVAAEYYVDDTFEKRLNKGKRLLTFGGNQLLVECSFINKPFTFPTTLSRLISEGYQPILAHPERYEFLEGSMDWLMELKNIGVRFQITLGSLSGYYGSQPEAMAKKLLYSDMADYLGSDLHGRSHVSFLRKGLKNREVQKRIRQQRFKNFELV